ncbi:MAG: DUF5717 family protein, partial [Defluviitaleaceae bacterium]|nr:DUF5717 family protein [Defluviitaleaceae bacterium]
NEKSISEDILPFIYHLVLKGALGGRHSEILERVKGDIAAFACRCLQNHLFGKYYYSMYKFLLGTDVFVESKYLNAAEEIIKQILFAYDIFANDGRTKKIVVQEEFKKQGEPLVLKEGRCRVSMWSGSAQIIGFDEDLRNIISKKPTATRLLENADLTLYKYFFRKGHQPLDLLIYLSNHYLQADQNNLPDEAVLVFKKTIATAGIDRAFLRMIHAALGNYYVRKKDFSKAAQYFKDLDEAAVNKQYLEGMLAAYISAKDYLSATRLAARWAGDISDKALFNAIKQMTPHIGGLNAKKSVAHAAAKLILNGWHDEDLLGLVLAHYDAPLAFWAELYKTLVSFGVFSNALCKKILETSMLARVCNKNVQSVFVNLAQNAPNEDGILTDYAIYLAYEIMINDLLPTNDTILAMEDIFVQSGQILLAYSLAIVYITRDEAKREYMREKSQKILDVALATAKRTDIIFPIFKEIKDKTTLLPYIEKNSPFVYKGKAQNEVVLHYRFNNNAEYSQKPMKYLAFGMHLCHLTHFYGENIEYYFSENMGGSSVKTAPQILANNNSHMLEKTSDLYYTIHNALVYEQMFKYDKVEEIVDAHLAQKNSIRAKII